MKKNIKPFINRPGTKIRIIKKILDCIPSRAYNFFIDLFVGGGSVFLNRQSNKNETIIINDIEEDIINVFQLLKKKTLLKPLPPSLLEKQVFYSTTPSNDEEQLQKYILKYNNTYSSMGKGRIFQNTNHINKIKNIELYHNLLENVKIYNEDYKTIIKKYDSIDSFFFIDPPYENSYKHKIYKMSNEFNYEELNEILLNIKGKFLLTINDSPTIRNIFKNFFFIENLVKSASVNTDIGKYDRAELIITNYKKKQKNI